MIRLTANDSIPTERQQNVFVSPYAGPHFMLLKLTPWLPAAGGELRHAAAFATLAVAK